MAHGKAKSPLGCLSNKFKLLTQICMDSVVLGVHVDVGCTLAVIEWSTDHQVFVTVTIEINGG